MKFKTKLHHFSIDVCCSAVIGWQTGAGLWLVVSSSRVNGHGSSRGRPERERERESPSRPASSSRTVARIIIVFVAVLATQNAHICTLSNIRPSGPRQPPTSARGWLAEDPCVAPRAPEQLQVSRVRTLLGPSLRDLGRNFSVSSRLFSIDGSKMGILANFA